MRRNDRLVLVFVFLGPLFGGMTFVVPAALYYWLIAPASGAELIIDNWPPIVIVGYVLGIIPAFTTAFLANFVTRWLAVASGRVFAAGAIGGVVSALIGIVGSLAQYSDGDLLIAGLFCFVPGAVAGVLCMVVVEVLHPLPARTVA